ncbi:hypothetical protein [Streptomyces roseolilacinus]|uniref:Transmembrane protein n=1 Tax=Streptomyces roseolilacinus TaxID=66904 RepID=A0A918EK44_9ACTN|nr:hypothetical protein [Streptomyces roseolilacinus]GGQ11974.1 hypothetical protein GCM10010249_33230 [Streptomyces roseolilacinus]
MKRAPHLLPEDRADYERLLDEALRTVHDRPDLVAVGRRLDTHQLRTMALGAAALISAAAATEYEHFVRVREERRRPPGASVMASVLGGPGDETTPGAGLGVVVTVLTPVLAGTAALVLLLTGYVLKMLDPPPDVTDPLLTAGWFFAAVAAVGLLVAAAGLLVTALRNRPVETPGPRGPGGDPPDEVSRAREAWRRALLERGILPFLREALAEPGGASASAPEPPRSLPPSPRPRPPGADLTGPGLARPEPGTE